MEKEILKKRVVDVIASKFGCDHIDHYNGIYVISICSNGLNRKEFKYQGLCGTNIDYVEDVIKIVQDIEVIKCEIEKMYDSSVVQTIMVEYSTDSLWGCELKVLI